MTQPSATQCIRSKSHEIHSKSALVVESNETLARAISKHLLSHNYSFELARTVSAAKEYIDKGKTPDLVLLDLLMPDGSGLTLLEYMKTKEEFRDVQLSLSVTTIKMAICILKEQHFSWIG